jgi:hypothetical protein
MSKLINKDCRKNKKRAKKDKIRQYRHNFRNKKQKALFENIFIDYHKEAISEIKNEKKRNASMTTQ